MKRVVPMLFVAAAFWAAHASAASADVVLNEVNCEGTDWIELANSGGAAEDVSGWLLTDEDLALPPGDEHLYEFPADTEIGAGDHLVVERTADFEFGISCSDQIRLGDETAAEIDTTVLDPPGQPGVGWGRYPDMNGPFMRTLATKGFANQPAEPDPGEDLAAWLFDPAKVVEIDLELPPASIESLGDEPYEEVEGEFSLTTTEGAYGPLTVGVRLKGNQGGSFRGLDGKAAFKVDFNEYVSGQRFLGLKGLTLNNMVQDPSMLHETLTYAVHRAAGVPAPRTGYAFVRLNGDAYGVYANIEEVDDVMLSRFFDTTQHLYEGSYGTDVTPGSAPLFEVDEGSESNREDLEALIAAAHSSWPDWSQAVGERLDLEEATLMWAVERYVGQWDSYSGEYDTPFHPNNYFLHSDADGRFSMLPWGADIGWIARQPFVGTTGGVLFERCQDHAACMATYRASLVHLRQVVGGMDLGGLALAASAAIRPWQEIDPRREQTMEQIDNEVQNWVLPFIAVRPSDLDVYLLITEPSGPDSAPAAPPETRITSGPQPRTYARRVKFKFAAEPSAAGFECKLNRGPYAPCASPYRIEVGPGRHRLRVRAVGGDGRVDQTADELRFEVLRKR